MSLQGCETIEFPGLLWGSWLLMLMKHIPPKESSFSEIPRATLHHPLINFQIFWTVFPCAVQIKWYFQVFCYFFSFFLEENYKCQVRRAHINKTPTVMRRILKVEYDVEIGVQFQSGWKTHMLLGNMVSNQMAGLPGICFKWYWSLGRLFFPLIPFLIVRSWQLAFCRTEPRELSLFLI